MSFLNEDYSGKGVMGAEILTHPYTNIDRNECPPLLGTKGQRVILYPKEHKRARIVERGHPQEGLVVRFAVSAKYTCKHT